jgi:hypothetical protein
VSFQTRAGNLAAGDNDNEYDVLVRHTAEGQTSRGSPAAGISRGSAMAGNGDFMAFESNAETLVPDFTAPSPGRLLLIPPLPFKRPTESHPSRAPTRESSRSFERETRASLLSCGTSSPEAP